LGKKTKFEKRGLDKGDRQKKREESGKRKAKVLVKSVRKK
jgi:hypothetical protein